MILQCHRNNQSELSICSLIQNIVHAEGAHPPTLNCPIQFQIFARVIETVAWHTLSPFEGVYRNIQRDHNTRLVHYNNLMSQYIVDQVKEPSGAGGTIADMMHSDALAEAAERDEQNRCADRSTEGKTSGHPRQPHEAGGALCTDPANCGGDPAKPASLPPRPSIPFPPDTCQLVFGTQPASSRIM